MYRYKGGSVGAANTGNEPYSEYYACQIAHAMGLRTVACDLENRKGILASKCKSFTDIDTAFVPIGRIVRTGGLRACLDYCAEPGEAFLENMKSMPGTKDPSKKALHVVNAWFGENGLVLTGPSRTKKATFGFASFLRSLAMLLSF
jgi:hypothetical protein